MSVTPSGFDWGMHPDRALAERARPQLGLITWNQLLEAGLSPKQIQSRVAWGVLVPVHPSVYLVAAAPVTWEQRLLAACLAAGPSAVVSHRAAAELWEFDVPERGLVEISVARPFDPRDRDVIRHRSTDLAPHHVTVRRGVPVTTPVRLLADIGAVVPWLTQQIYDAGLVRKLFTAACAERILTEVGRRGRRGVGPLRRVVDRNALGDVRPDGLLELRMARLMRDHGLPPWVFQHEVVAGGRRFRIDFAYPRVKLAIEVDGYAHHRTKEQMQRDLDRQNVLVSLGWTLLRFTWHDVVKRPEYVAAQILRVLGTLSAA